MPDEETIGAPAVEPAPIPDEVAEPSPAQEPVEPEGQGEAASGAEATDEGAGQEADPDADFQAAKAALKESDPERYTKLFGDEPPATPEERERELAAREARIEAEARKTRRAGAVNASLSGAAAYSGQNLQQQVANAIHPHVAAADDAVKEAIQKATKGEEYDVPAIDYAALFADALTVAQNAALAWGSWQDQAAWAAAVTAFEGSEVYQHLSRDERTKVDALEGKPQAERIAGLIWVGIQAGLRAAPEEFKAKTRRQIEKELSAGEAFGALLASIGNGKSATKGGSGPKGATAYKELTDEERGKLTPEEIDARTKKFLSQPTRS